MYNKLPDFSKNPKQTPRSVEPVGVIPRSLIRTLNRFLTQLFQNSNSLVIEEFRISRYQVLVSIQSLVSLIFIPLIINFLAKTFVLVPLTEYLWNRQQDDIFLNSYLEKEALLELQDFEKQLYFDYFLSPNRYETPTWATYQIGPDTSAGEFPSILKSEIQKKTVDLATSYNKKSIEALTNLFGDLVSFATLGLVIIVLKPQIIIFKSFLIEFIYSLSDTIKSALLILATNLLVGFHSPRGWELFLEFFLNRFGFPPNENFIFLFVATFPVLLDTIFKYWIFRYLNKISPSTVATYHAMLE
uniref:Potassium/proton antiporter CemA n=1 Tax=Halochlorococcum sp. NIES-1838 TaxID=2249730 RepID=A0A2Z4M9W1_9CHLO|nr:CemA [Halochlorococcum sp. NIES-1838]